MPKKRHNWKRAHGWRSHSLAAWDAEHAEWKKCAEAAGKPLNGWIREWLNEAVKYERLTERDELQVAHSGPPD